MLIYIILGSALCLLALAAWPLPAGFKLFFIGQALEASLKGCRHLVEAKVMLFFQYCGRYCGRNYDSMGGSGQV